MPSSNITYRQFYFLEYAYVLHTPGLYPPFAGSSVSSCGTLLSSLLMPGYQIIIFSSRATVDSDGEASCRVILAATMNQWLVVVGDMKRFRMSLFFPIFILTITCKIWCPRHFFTNINAHLIKWMLHWLKIHLMCLWPHPCYFCTDFLEEFSAQDFELLIWASE
jgi:hypothetical protein